MLQIVKKALGNLSDKNASTEKRTKLTMLPRPFLFLYFHCFILFLSSQRLARVPTTNLSINWKSVLSRLDNINAFFFFKSKNWCFQTVVLEKALESPLDCKIKPVNPKGNQSWIFIGRTDAEVDAPILWPPDKKSWLIRKDPDAGKDWSQEEKGTTEDEMVGWHHWLNGHESEQAPGVGDIHGLQCCSPLSNWKTTTLLFISP